MTSGLVHRLGDHVDTDRILPGRYLALREPAQLGPHCLEGYDPTMAARIAKGDILAAGINFGSGSSREHAVIALIAAGVGAIVAASVARIFHRNAINLGLPVLVSPEAAAELVAGEKAEIDLFAGRIAQGGREWRVPPVTGDVAAILRAGGLVPWVRQALAQT